MTAVIQTMWAELIATSLADAGVTTCVVSPGSRSTPLIAALASDGRFELPTLIDERAAAFYALGAARATGVPVAMVCTSGTAAAHYLPAIIEASLAGVPLVAITADRPPELQHCGTTQTIDQRGLFGGFVRAAFDLGAPVASALALRAVRRTMFQAIMLARGPRPGPVHLNAPLRKPLEPARPSTAGTCARPAALPNGSAVPSTEEDHTLAAVVAELRAIAPVAPPPRFAADPSGIAALAAAIAAEPHGILIAGAMPLAFATARDPVLALAARAGYPLLAEAGSQLRFAARPDVTVIDHFDLVLGSPLLAGAPAPKLVIRLGAEPVAAGWIAAQPVLAGAAQWVLADHDWHDPESSARGVIVGDVATSCAALANAITAREDRTFAAAWLEVERRATVAVERALADQPRAEGAVMRAAIAAMPAGAIVQLGNSLPIRVVDQVCTGGERAVITQRGAAGIDGLIASAAGATLAGVPVLLVLGDVSFAHDLGGLLATRATKAPLAIVVIDNGGGRIFGGLPIARAAHSTLFDRHFITAPAIDPAAVATALGIRSVTAASAGAVGAAVAAALASTDSTVIHAAVTPTGARDLRLAALEHLACH